MKTKHTPTAAMQSAAKRGLQSVKDGGLEPQVMDISMKSGKKIASGQQVSDDHVRSMADYHSAHMGDCPAGGDAEHAEDLLWGGPAGAGWAASRVAAMDATSLADSESPDLDKLISGTDPFSLEVYARRDLLGERIDLKKGDDGLIWAPILRSGTLALRPDPKSPNGRKAEPLVFVPGHAAGPQEIGLGDLKDAFEDEAVQHVTIPKTHGNDEFENTGFIRKLRISESTLRPGEQVLVAGHEFLDGDAEQRVESGLIANRSCGILHGYQNTETGKTYPHVIEHVALTNKPWVTGMEPYGSDAFSDGRQVVPLMLSEERAVTAPDPDAVPRAIFSTATPRERLERELNLADVVWSDQDGEPSLSQIKIQLYDALRGMGSSPYYDENSVYFDVIDVRPSSALVGVDYGGSDPHDAWVVPFSMDAGKLTLSDFSQWKVVEQAWVADDDANQDKAEVQALLREGADATALEANPKLTEGQLNLATLTSKARKDLPETAFVFPKTREYPIQDLAHARNALSRGAQNETGARLSAIKSAVYKKYPQLGPDSGKGKTNASLPDDPLKRASMLRLSQEPMPTQQGDPMLDKTLLERLDLSPEAREVLQREAEAQERQAAELAEYRKDGKKAANEARVTKLSEMGFAADSGFLTVVGQLLEADDGDVAVTLLSTAGAKTHLTVSQVIDKLIEAFPTDDKGRLTLAGKTNLLENPLSGRPDLKPDPAEVEGGEPEKDGDQLLAEWNKALPGGLDLAIAAKPATPAPAAAATQ